MRAKKVYIKVYISKEALSIFLLSHLDMRECSQLELNLFQKQGLFIEFYCLVTAFLSLPSRGGILLPVHISCWVHNFSHLIGF